MSDGNGAGTVVEQVTTTTQSGATVRRTTLRFGETYWLCVITDEAGRTWTAASMIAAQVAARDAELARLESVREIAKEVADGDEAESIGEADSQLEYEENEAQEAYDEECNTAQYEYDQAVEAAQSRQNDSVENAQNEHSTTIDRLRSDCDEAKEAADRQYDLRRTELDRELAVASDRFGEPLLIGSRVRFTDDFGVEYGGFLLAADEYGSLDVVRDDGRLGGGARYGGKPSWRTSTASTRKETAAEVEAAADVPF